MNHFWTLVWKDLQMEWRKKYALTGAMVYTLSAVFVSYLTFELSITPFTPATWQALFWVIFLFSATNLVARSFIHEEGPARLYLYQLTKPGTLILAKISYNALVLACLGSLTWGFYALVFGSPLEQNGLFLACIFTASLSFSASLSLIASIAMKGANPGTLMVILGFPIVIPQVLLLVRMTLPALTGGGWDMALQPFALLGALDAIAISLSYLLFPYLWRS